MKALLITLWARIRISYWFVPSWMALAAILLSFATTAIDARIGSEWFEQSGWFYANKPAGARAVLSTVAGSMITVAGVTFSMTILSISHTTSQVGPRLLNNFMRDTGNQITLGVFISTFLYCLMVLRTVRNADTAPPGGNEQGMDLASAFVPHVAVFVGLLMAIASVGVLIFFIHHIPESIHVSNIVARVGRELNDRIEDQFPSLVGDPSQEESDRKRQADLPSTFYESARKVESGCPGYVEYVDGEGLMRIASKHDLVLLVKANPGDFVTADNALLLASPASKVDDATVTELAALIVCGEKRTPTQDLRFQMNQLVEVAMRALSPGVNDPFTAINCMDWLESTLKNFANRSLPDAHRYDDRQVLRVVAEAETFASFASLVCDQLRPYVSKDRNAAIHMMKMVANITVSAPRDAQRSVLLMHAEALRQESTAHLRNERDISEIEQSYERVARLVRDPGYLRRAVATA